MSYTGHWRPVNRRCPPAGHSQFAGRRCPLVKFPGLKVKISTFAAVSPSGSSSWLILRHLRLICSTYLVERCREQLNPKIFQNKKFCWLLKNLIWPLTYFWKWLPATGSLGTGQSDTRDLVVAGVRISISPKYLYLALKVLTTITSLSRFSSISHVPSLHF